MEAPRIRNFSIIAHIDHGKSTLADRLLEATGALTEREMEAQVLDSMDLERERGITIKAHAVRLEHKLPGESQPYILNLIDTPGHVDFSYEVSRSLAACEGALLVVDASQGVEAQTLANTELAVANNLEIIPVINKIDLSSADPERVIEQIEHVIGLDAQDAILISAKEGRGTEEVLSSILSRVPPPVGDPAAPLKALIFDSWYDSYRGVVVLIRIIDGTIVPGCRIRFMSSRKSFEVAEVGVFTPKMTKVERLSVGEVGYLVAGIRQVEDTQVGDTLTEENRPTATPLPGFQEVRPMVFAGLYPVETSSYETLRDALSKLRLNDSSFFYEPETSAALGFGFRCGFLGLLHMEIIRQRLEREFGLSLLTTAPGVRYRVTQSDGQTLEVDNPSKLPPAGQISRIEEPILDVLILTPDEYIGPILRLLEQRRGVQTSMEYLSATRVSIRYKVPLNEVVMDFHDRLKAVSRGYASFDYQLSGYQTADLVKLDILVNGEPVDALSLIVHKEQAYARGRSLVSRLGELIPRQLFEVAIQAAVGSRVIARETVAALRKNVIAKCYGGDITRKRKLLEKQKEGKRRMKRVGRVDIPQEAFLAVLKTEVS
ncbi:MAG TPA: translation elongation factor 4 [Vicinamibacteria bacterium]|nr:translation elongation factor 4 [Vicinamibacteria bacterium]